MSDKNSAWAAFIARYRDDPAGFSRHVIGMDPLPWQTDVMQAVASGSRRVAVKSGHGVGKSSCAAVLILWFLATKFPCKVVVTAPTAAQLYDALFAECKRRLKALPEPIGDLFEATSDRIVLKSSPSESFCSARSCSKERPEALAGIHQDHVLLIVDEASGVPDVVFESGSGSMSGHNATTLLLGNPVRASGFFYRAHTELSKDWWTRTVSCADNPLVSADFLRDMAARYGEESNAYRVRVTGEWPIADEDTLIPLMLIESARDRDVDRTEVAPVIYGLDPARYGSDRSALAKRCGNYLIEPPKVWRDKSTMELCGIVQAEYEATKPSERPEEICVDSIGIGAGVVDRLIEMDLPARGINVAESASLNQKYVRLRDELWSRAREWFESKEVHIPDDAQLIAELAAPRFAFTSSGKIKIESKDEMRRRGVGFGSPDLADAFCLTFASNAVTAAHGTRYAWNRTFTPDTSYVV